MDSLTRQVIVTDIKYVKFKTLKAVTMKNTALWYVTRCILVTFIFVSEYTVSHPR